jgi:hypothetical protein
MAWATKYRGEYKDIEGVAWKIDIEEDGATTLDTLLLSGDPLQIDWDMASDDYNEPIKYSRAKITVISQANFVYTDLYSTQDQQFRISIYQNTVLYWRGYIKTGDYSEPYEEPPYPVTITATCGLELLKEYLYKYQTTNPDDTYYNGRRLESQIILDVLGKIGHTTFSEYINIYEESMDDGVGDSPTDQTKIDVDVFKDLYCDDILKEILQKCNACIIQKAGTFHIYRPEELKLATVYGRTFTASATKTAISFVPNQFINRTGHSTTIKQVSGGVMMIQDPAKKITISQDAGNRDSWLDNWKFEPDKFSGTYLTGFNYIDSLVIEGWSKNNPIATQIQPAYLSLPSDNNGVYLSPENTTPALAIYLSQSFGDDAVDGGEQLNIEFEYQWWNVSGAAHPVTIRLSIKADNSNYSLQQIDDTYAEWVTPAAIIEDVDPSAPEGFSGWKTWKRTIAGGTAVDGPFTIKIFNPDDTYLIGMYIRNVKYYVSGEVQTSKVLKRKTFQRFPIMGWGEGIFKGRGFNILVTDKESNLAEIKYLPTCTPTVGRELEFNYSLGDVIDAGITNVLPQFKGSLGTYITTLQYRVDKVTLEGASGEVDITCNNWHGDVEFDTNLATTAQAFVTAYGTGYFDDIVITRDNTTLIFTSQVLGLEFTGDTSSETLSGDLAGVVTMNFTTAASYALSNATNWNTRSPGSESKEILKIIGDEIAKQYSRPKQLVQMPIQDLGSGVSAINILGNFQDILNAVTSGSNLITDPADSDDYDSVDTIGVRISDAINTGGTHFISSNSLGSHTYRSALLVILDVNLISGQLPFIRLNHSGDVFSNEVQLSEGPNRVILTLNDSGTVVLQILNTMAAHWSTSSIFVYAASTRKFAFNRGSFDTKNRRWNIDLMEII